MSGLRLCLVIAALLAGSLAFGCNGDDDNGDDTADPTATEAVDGDATDGDGDDGDGDATDGNGDGADGDGDDLAAEIREFAEQFGVKEVRIDYAFSDGTTDEGDITLYWKPPDAWRMDISGSFGDATLITNAETSYLCGSDGGEGQCLESPLAQAIPLPFLSIFTDPEEFSDLIDTSLFGVDVDRSEREIAGQDGTCFSVSGEFEDATGSAEYCFRDDGILLSLRAGGDSAEGFGEFTLEATSVEDSVSDEDLEPPYDVMEIPGVP